MNTHYKEAVSTVKVFRVAAILLTVFISACTTTGGAYEEWTALGYLTPGPTSEPEVIGVYERQSDCIAAGEAWMSRQVVGNPVFSECLPTDRN
ncbi:hypothetical protein PUV54_15085 [Hyphococcus flavus]|uniref:Uncharacterized protein n=1 Tax=Hyphococcus flavus TaxID=1866326 RepID=A0AAF0CGY6_9PROT|nr:hypothetical protein [Hyphococcus flavus]WDI31272.1 hypothetical protein PUV54_15085 [Hyphococcus flavus]